MCQWDSECIAQYGRSRATQDATGHHYWASICPILALADVVWCYEVVSKAIIQKEQNRPSTQLIKATSCIERSNTTIEAEDLSYYSSYQTLTMDKN